MNTQGSRYFFVFYSICLALILSLMLSLSACSSSKKPVASTSAGSLNQQHKVELGTVVSARTVNLKAQEVESYGRVGVTANSGGSAGIHGSIDIGTLSRLFKNATGPKTAQEVIVKKSNGDIVAITQEYKEDFAKGDEVKILLRGNGEAQVIH